MEMFLTDVKVETWMMFTVELACPTAMYIPFLENLADWTLLVQVRVKRGEREVKFHTIMFLESPAVMSMVRSGEISTSLILDPLNS